MQKIIAGRVETQERAEELLAMLRERGVAMSDMYAFYLTSPGQRAQFPIGGDQYSDPDAEGAPQRQAKGIALGAAAGLAVGGIAAVAVPPLAPVIIAGVTGVGALAGSVAGAVSGTDHASRPSRDDDSRGAEEHSRQGGMMVAVRVTPTTETAVVEAFEASGADAIERATGKWRDGRWVDFDPMEAPDKIGQ
jgi:hypothetical protein